MTGIKAERRNDLAPAGNTPATQDDGGTSTPVGRFCAGSRVTVRCRRLEAFMNATTTGGAQLQWEGPYLRIRPLWGSTEVADGSIEFASGYGRKLARGVIAQRDDVYSMTEAPGTITVLGNQPFYYDIDALAQSSIYLPFNASLEILQPNAGVAVYDVWEIPPNEAPPPTYRQEFTQTRYCRTGQTKRVTVPMGAQEMAFFGDVDNAAVQLETEDTGKVSGGGSSILAMPMFDQGTAGMRIPCGGVRTVQMSPAANSCAVTFYITI